MRHPASARPVGGVHLAARAAGIINQPQPTNQPTPAAPRTYCTSPVGSSALRSGCMTCRTPVCFVCGRKGEKKTNSEVDRSKAMLRSIDAPIDSADGGIFSCGDCGWQSCFISPHPFSDAARVCGGALQRSVVSPRSHASQGGFRAIRIPHSLLLFF